MRKIMLLAALAATTAISAPAMAGSADGKIQIKVLGTGVLPNGKIDKVKSAIPAVVTALGANPGTKASDNVVPTIAIEYFATPNVSVETICCLTTHHVTGTGSVAGANLVNHVMILPATVTLKYHLDAGPIKPYIGAGPSVFFVIDEKPGSTARARRDQGQDVEQHGRRPAGRLRHAAQRQRHGPLGRREEVLRQADRQVLRRQHAGAGNQAQARSVGDQRGRHLALLIAADPSGC